MDVRLHYKKKGDEEEENLFATSGEDTDDPDGTTVRDRHAVKVKCSLAKERSCRRVRIVGVILVLVVVLIIGISVLHMTKSASKPSGTRWDEVIQSPSDKRTYLATKLSNGLRVLLIQDIETDFAAASMDVAVGHYDNPDDTLGLAHFCEHMLFMGTKKYPSESGYSSFISEHGGYDNAYTSNENTNYYFKVSYDQLKPTLDQFLQFFVAPLFHEQSITREVHAVDSEYRKDLPVDGWRYLELLKTTANPKHPFSRFDIGSLQTLQKPDIRQRLLKFHHDHYTVNRLHLAVIGRESIEQQLAWVKEMAGSIPDRTSQLAVIKYAPYPPSFTARQVWVRPNQADDYLTLYFPIPSVLYLYRSKPVTYLNWFLGHEGTGSLLYVLRRKRLASALTAALELNARDSAVLSLDVRLTSDGLDHIDDIVSLVFQYIRLINASGVTKAIWDKQQALREVDFRFRTSDDPASYVTRLASRMRYVNESRDLLSPPCRSVWDPAAINNILRHLTPRNLMLHLASHLNVSYDRMETFFQIKYKVAPIAEARLNRWETDASESGLALPLENPFIPSNFSLVPLPKDATDLPSLVVNDAGMKVWWLVDHVFRDPRLGLHCSVIAPRSRKTAKDAAALGLLSALVDDSLAGVRYDASLAGYSLNPMSSMTTSGFHLSVDGYSDPKALVSVIQVMTQEIAHPKSLYSLERFNLTKEDYMTSLESYWQSQQPFRLALHYIEPLLLQENFFRIADILSAARSLTQFDVQVYLLNLFSMFSVSCLVHGNVDKNQAISYVKAMAKELPSMPAFPENLWTSTQRLMLPLGDPQMARLRSLDKTNQNSVLLQVYQIGPACSANGNATHPSSCSATGLRYTVLLELIMLAIANPCFEQLRTVDKLGYVVFCLHRQYEQVLSFQVLIQSAQFTPSYMQERAELFLSSFNSTLASLAKNTSWWVQLRASARKTFMQKDLTRVDGTKRLYGQISARTFIFTFKEQLLETLDSITDSMEMVHFYNRYLLMPNLQRKLSVQLYGEGKQRSTNGTDLLELDGLHAWRQNFTFYPSTALPY